MRSKHVDDFNHDPWADGYDEDVLNEADPIRAGYEALLTWIAKMIEGANPQTIVDLGSGTGNLSLRLPLTAKVTLVDTSKNMHAIARGKLKNREVEQVTEDILSFLTELDTPFDAFVSTYAFHHLTTPEKKLALEAMITRLNPGGIIAIGDLMFESQEARRDSLAAYQAEGKAELAQDIEEEFFWEIEKDRQALDQVGLSVEIRQFSALSWGVIARKN